MFSLVYFVKHIHNKPEPFTVEYFNYEVEKQQAKFKDCVVLTAVGVGVLIGMKAMESNTSDEEENN